MQDLHNHASVSSDRRWQQSVLCASSSPKRALAAHCHGLQTESSGSKSTTLLIHLRAPERFMSTFWFTRDLCSHWPNLQTARSSHQFSSAVVFSACNCMFPFPLAALAAHGRGAASRAGCHETTKISFRHQVSPWLLFLTIFL